MRTAFAAPPGEPVQEWLPGFSQPVQPPVAVGPLLRLPKAYRRALDEIVSVIHRIDQSPLDAQGRRLLFERLTHCRTLGGIAVLRDRLDTLIEDTVRMQDARLDAPLRTAPPLPGANWIEPLTTLRMVIDEGEQMHHCLADHYLNWIDAGNYYAYRVLAPVRLTAGLELGDDGRWQLDDIAGVGNREPPEQLRRRVLRWLEGNMDFDNLRALQVEIREACADAAYAMRTEIMSDAKSTICNLQQHLQEMAWTDHALAEAVIEQALKAE